jgi:hypothetical protein
VDPPEIPLVHLYDRRSRRVKPREQRWAPAHQGVVGCSRQGIPCTTRLFQTSCLAASNIARLFPTTSFELSHQDFIWPSRTSAVEPVAQLRLFALRRSLPSLTALLESPSTGYSCMDSAVFWAALVCGTTPESSPWPQDSQHCLSLCCTDKTPSTAACRGLGQHRIYLGISLHVLRSGP